MSKTAIFPGSFDPFTIGHLDIIQRALPLFDTIIVAIGNNREKSCMFSLEERLDNIRKVFKTNPHVEVVSYSGLTTDLCREKGARFILRGVRNLGDYEYERNIADINRTIAPDIETVLLFADPSLSVISSSMVRELNAFGKDITPYLPQTADK